MQEEDIKPELDHVTRLGIMGEIAANLAHELNQPLSAISLYCDAALAAVQSKQIPDPSLAGLIESAREQAMRAGEIVRHMRQFIRSADLQGQSVQLNDLARQMMAYVESEAKQKKILLESSLEKRLPELNLNRVQMAQVFGTLLHLSLSDSDDDHAVSGKIIVNTSLTDDAVAFRVSRQGSRWANKNGSDHTGPESDEQRNAADVALSISRSIVEAHGGQLLQSSNQFEVMLPLEAN